MQYIDWSTTPTLESPIYLDANILVGTIVSNHRLYATCVRLMADILLQDATVLVSPLSADECIWATAKLAYCDLFNQRPDAPWNKRIYRRWCDKIFESYEGWMTAVGSMIRDWSAAGVTIQVVPRDEDLWLNALNAAPHYMRQFRLTPADAFHLALAEVYASTLITADHDFKVIGDNPPPGPLTIVHIAG